MKATRRSGARRATTTARSAKRVTRSTASGSTVRRTTRTTSRASRPARKAAAGRNITTRAATRGTTSRVTSRARGTTAIRTRRTTPGPSTAERRGAMRDARTVPGPGASNVGTTRYPGGSRSAGLTRDRDDLRRPDESMNSAVSGPGEEIPQVRDKETPDSEKKRSSDEDEYQP